MTTGPEAASIPGERSWKRRWRILAVVGLAGGLSGMFFILTRGTSEGTSRLRPFELFAGAAVVGLIALLALGFWRGILQRPALAGGLVSGALFSFSLVVGHFSLLPVLCLLLVPIGGALAARMSRATPTEEDSRRSGARIGALSGVIASLVAFGSGLPVALVINQVVADRFARKMMWFAPDVAASHPELLSSSAAGEVGGVLFIALLVVGLGWLGGAFEDRQSHRARQAP